MDCDGFRTYRACHECDLIAAGILDPFELNIPALDQIFRVLHELEYFAVAITRCRGHGVMSSLLKDSVLVFLGSFGFLPEPIIPQRGSQNDFTEPLLKFGKRLAGRLHGLLWGGFCWFVATLGPQK